ncbi:MAG: TolC family protein [Candidatus Nitrospinota bacterium M3_3B_026]
MRRENRTKPAVTRRGAGKLARTIALLAASLLLAAVPGEGAGGDDGVLSLTLEDAVNIALTANRSLIMSRRGLKDSRLSVVSAKSDFDVKIYPAATAQAAGGDAFTSETLGLGVSLEKKFATGSRLSITPAVASLDGDEGSSVDISLEQPLFRGAGLATNLNEVKAAEYSLRSSERRDYQARVNVMMSAVSAFYEVARQREILRLNEELAERLRGHAEAARAKEKAGYASPIDVYRAEIRLKDAEDSVAVAAESYQNAGDNLKTILALPQDKPLAVSAPLGREGVRMERARAVVVAMKNRVEIEQAEENIAEAERLSGVSWRRILPDINLAVDYSRFESAGGEALGESRWMARLVGRSDVARTRERIAHQRALFGLEDAKIRLEQVKDEITKQVAASLRALRRADDLERIRAEQITQAEGKLELAKVKFNHGLADNFDLIEAEMELRRAVTNRLVAAIDYIVETYRLRAALGTLLEREG